MAENPPTSPFAGLGSDKALLRQTRPRPAAATSPTEAVPPAPTPITESEPTPITEQAEERSPRRAAPTRRPPITPSKQGSKIPRHHGTEIPEYHGEIVDVIRRVVRSPGKEAATLRLSVDEKDRLAEVIFDYRRQGRKTSVTEIIRIAISFLLEEHEANGQDSILSQVMEALVS